MEKRDGGAFIKTLYSISWVFHQPNPERGQWLQLRTKLYFTVPESADQYIKPIPLGTIFSILSRFYTLSFLLTFIEENKNHKFKSYVNGKDYGLILQIGQMFCFVLFFVFFALVKLFGSWIINEQTTKFCLKGYFTIFPLSGILNNEHIIGPISLFNMYKEMGSWIIFHFVYFFIFTDIRLM